MLLKSRQSPVEAVNRVCILSSNKPPAGSSSRMTKPLNMGKLHEAAVTGDYKTVKALIKAGTVLMACYFLSALIIINNPDPPYLVLYETWVCLKSKYE